jgi:hypothetical protein
MSDGDELQALAEFNLMASRLQESYAIWNGVSRAHANWVKRWSSRQPPVKYCGLLALLTVTTGIQAILENVTSCQANIAALFLYDGGFSPPLPVQYDARVRGAYRTAKSPPEPWGGDTPGRPRTSRGARG